MIGVYFLWFHYWTLKEWKTARAQSHSVSVITDACVKIAAVELCFEKKIKESVVETFRKCFAGFFGKKNVSKDILGKIDKKLLSDLVDFGH